MNDMLDISVLYVEDETGIRQSVARSLSLLVKNVHTAENGLVALEKLHEHPIDLIISDIKMPKMDGLSLVEQLREEGYTIPVVITSAFNETEYLSKAIDLKVDKFINKPIRISDLLGTISKVAEAIYNKQELRLKQQELEHYRQAIEQTNFVMHITPEGSLLSMNRELSDYFDEMGEEDFSFSSIYDLLDEAYVSELLEKVETLKIFSKMTLLTLNNKNYTIWITAFPSVLKEDRIIEITLLLTNISEVVREKDAMIEKLYTDELTGLPNRQRLFHDLAGHDKKMAMVIVDIDGFSNLNHLYGFDTGDDILRQMATILSGFRPGTGGAWQLYRSDMDHFVILLEKMGLFDPDQAQALAKQIITHVDSHPFVIGGVLRIDVGITVGASCIEKTDLYAEASLALKFAKSSHKAFQCYSDLDGLKEHFEANLLIQGTIKNALCNDTVMNYYQPIFDAEGLLVKYEALVRIRDPENPEHILTPYHFLDIARQSKNYPLLTKRVIDNAFRDFASSPHGFSINLSFDDITNPEISLYLEERIKKHQGGEVTLELLESEGLKDIGQTISFCRHMKSLGAQIAIDDFGSGYSNFVYFFDMPIDILKIDGSLVRRIHDYRGYIALETIVKFADNLGVKTVAEFVEDEAVFNKLKTLGIDMFQGYYFSPPKPFGEL